jgi:hypothetical protein
MDAGMQEAARKIITLKEIEPLIEAKYRCGLHWTLVANSSQSCRYCLSSMHATPMEPHALSAVCVPQRAQGQHERRATGGCEGAAARRWALQASWQY